MKEGTDMLLKWDSIYAELNTLKLIPPKKGYTGKANYDT
jgi:hypothetical protein